jgi:hypothetical protein
MHTKSRADNGAVKISIKPRILVEQFVNLILRHALSRVAYTKNKDAIYLRVLIRV